MKNSASQEFSTPSQEGAKRQLRHRADFELSTPWQAPQTEVEVIVAAIWQHVLSVDMRRLA